MPFPTEHSLRLESPKKYKKFRRENNKFGSGIDAIWGITSDGKAELQAVRFKKDKHNVEDVKAWAKKNNKTPISITPAKNHDEGAPAPASASSITVTTALRGSKDQKGLSTQYSEDQNELDDDVSDDLIDMLAKDDLDLKELEMGIQHEMEHTSDRSIAFKIAFDHLEEHPDYYSKLAEAEKHMDHASPIKHNEFEKDVDDDDDEDYMKEPDELEIEAFSVGTHVSAEGDESTYTQNDLDKMAEEYNKTASIDPAPVVIGHPETNSPAYGWIKSARTFEGKLLVKAHQLNKDFVDALKNNSYKKVSLSLYDTDDGPRIRHLGYLGGMAPAVKGLKPASFATSIIYKTFSEEFKMPEPVINVEELKKENSFFKKLFHMFKVDVKNFSDNTSINAMEKGKSEDEDKDLDNMSSEDTKKSITEKETKDPGEATEASPEEKEVKAKILNEANEESDENAQLKKEVAALKSECEALKAALAKDHSESKKASLKSFCEDLVKEGRLRPADVEMTLLNLEARENLDSVRNYSEDQSSLRKYKEALKAMPKVISFGEFPAVPNMTSGVSVPTVGIDNMSSYIESKIKDKLASTPNISYVDAMKACMAEAEKEHPTEYRAYVANDWIPKK